MTSQGGPGRLRRGIRCGRLVTTRLALFWKYSVPTKMLGIVLLCLVGNLGLERRAFLLLQDLLHFLLIGDYNGTKDDAEKSLLVSLYFLYELFCIASESFDARPLFSPCIIHELVRLPS